MRVNQSNAISISISGLIKLRELIRSSLNKNVEIHLRQADSKSYGTILKEIKNKEICNLIIDTKLSNIQQFLKGVRSTLEFISIIFISRDNGIKFFQKIDLKIMF